MEKEEREKENKEGNIKYIYFPCLEERKNCVILFGRKEKRMKIK